MSIFILRTIYWFIYYWVLSRGLRRCLAKCISLHKLFTVLLMHMTIKDWTALEFLSPFLARAKDTFGLVIWEHILRHHCEVRGHCHLHCGFVNSKINPVVLPCFLNMHVILSNTLTVVEWEASYTVLHPCHIIVNQLVKCPVQRGWTPQTLTTIAQNYASWQVFSKLIRNQVMKFRIQDIRSKDQSGFHFIDQKSH